MFDICLFVCLFVWGISSHSKIYHSYGDVTITGAERLEILTFARHLWPLSSEGSLACRTYCDTSHQFMMVISFGGFVSVAATTCFTARVFLG